VLRPPLRFGLIGCGQQGRQLAAALRRVPDTQLTACSDPDPVALNAIRGARVARFADYRADYRSSPRFGAPSRARQT